MRFILEKYMLDEWMAVASSDSLESLKVICPIGYRIYDKQSKDIVHEPRTRDINAK